MKSCKCGCGQYPFSVRLDKFKRKNGTYDFYLRLYLTDFILGHSTRKKIICSFCKQRIWAYGKRKSHRNCSYKIRGMNKVGINHFNWKGGKENRNKYDKERYITRKLSQIEVNKSKERLNKYNKNNPFKSRARAYLHYYGIKKDSKIFKEAIKFKQMEYKFKEALNGKRNHNN